MKRSLSTFCEERSFLCIPGRQRPDTHVCALLILKHLCAPAELASCPENSTKPPMYCLDSDPSALLFADYCIPPPMFLKGCSCESRISVEGSEELILPACRP